MTTAKVVMLSLSYQIRVKSDILPPITDDCSIPPIPGKLLSEGRKSCHSASQLLDRYPVDGCARLRVWVNC